MATQHAKAAFDAAVAAELTKHQHIERVSLPTPLLIRLLICFGCSFELKSHRCFFRFALQGECAAGHKLKSGTAAESDYRKHFPDAESTDVWCTVCDAKHPAAEMSSCRECDIDYCRACISLCADPWECGTCHFRNHAATSTPRCEMCSADKPLEDSPAVGSKRARGGEEVPVAVRQYGAPRGQGSPVGRPRKIPPGVGPESMPS